MPFINIFVSKNAYIYTKNNQLYLENNGDKVDYPLEDINAIMIENLNTTISTYSLSKFAELGILVYVCDQTHLPCGVMLPFMKHYQTVSQYEFQVNASKPLKKHLWQTIIKNKIKNQNDVLNLCGGKDELKALFESVASGDSTNNEAKASLIYFKRLFGSEFVRRKDCSTNSFLNYGYSILRGLISRSIVMHGLTPFLGLFHHNVYNQFNLADDLIEVFRPVVELYVKIRLKNEQELTTKIKGELFGIINIDVKIENQKQTVSNAIDMLVESYIKSLREGKDILKNIEILGLEFHKYE